VRRTTSKAPSQGRLATSPLRCLHSGFTLKAARSSRQHRWETSMAWKTPKIVEVPVGMEINMYACAARK
jgi:coenzyme PQQ precursor peptide PqqA